MNVFELIIVSCFMFMFFGGVAQSYIDASSEWTLLQQSTDMAGSHKKYLKIRIDGDTVIQSKTYYKLYQEGIDSINVWGTFATVATIPKSFYGLLRESGKKFYSYAQNLGDYLLYNFEKEIGDSINYNTYCQDTVSQIDTVYLGATPLKKWTFHDTSSVFSFIEGVGPISGVLESKCRIICCGGSALLCYEKQGNQIVVTPGFSCSVNTSLENILEKNTSVSIYPNPSLGDFFIQFDTETIKRYQVFDINGRLLEKKDIESSFLNLNLSNYPKGTYVLKLEGEKSVVVEKLVRW